MSDDRDPSAAAAGSLILGGDLEVNRMGFGAMRLTGEGIWGPPGDEEQAKRVLRRAIELGVDFIDTADAYGPDVSERLIAEALHPYPEGLVIATKGGLTRSGPNEWHPDGRPEHLREALEGSLRRLKLERIDLYQFHRPDPDIPLEESLGCLVELREQGKIRHIGVSNVDVDQLETAVRVADVVSVQNRYNLRDRDAEDVLEACEERGLAFLPWFPLAAGPLAEGEGPVAEVAREAGASPAQVALAWLLERSPATLPIPGTSSVEHLEENVAAAGLELSAGQLEALDEAASVAS